MLSKVPGVAFVEDVTLSAKGPSGESRNRADSGATGGAASATTAIAIEPHELPKVTSADVDLVIEVMRGAVGQKGADWDVWSPEEE